MFWFDILLFFVTIVVWIFITGWFTPVILVIMNRLLVSWFNPFLLVFVWMLAWTVWDILLRHFDWLIHSFLQKHFKIKKENHVLNKKKWPARKVSHKIWEKIQIWEHNKIILFFEIMCSSFSFIPDFLIVEFSRKKMKFHTFVFAMFLWKFFVYWPLVLWSLWFIDIINSFLQ